MNTANTDTEKATFGAGCFWGVEEEFRKQPGVISTLVGYLGGTLENPSYEDVCTDKTGHAEVVEVTFNPAKITYKELLNIFFNLHDPTQLNRQGPDHGSQYRSAVFFHSPEQETDAVAFRNKVERSGRFKKPIVTEISRASKFFPAEDYHQQYLAKRGLASCKI